ncbi:TIGR03766 family XrtG-associated glycosyltransferase [Levilactobacillus suantsaii]|uniref:Glycosyltransferase RgtA/B/C/D-like domain-containing protein n=1 Tax=Levilactobacillus suantsaii TaxID=2292255 RepID=A0A4Q0VKK5_9LACO|nr:TIGR03766 family XrtG-associated glycosyltransferase [Levilactobacillus suantsaii]QMU08774.1 hypothetical protein H3M12_03695 [Levilactobacillus suantsaii]RXI78945.1 hypothetical protein DXH47_05390 [Levilactobacillus suantsaii]
MRQQFYHFNTRALKLIFYGFFILTFGFALTSPNLILGDNAVTKVGTTGVTTGVLLLALAIALTLYVSPHARRLGYKVFVTNRWVTASGCLGLVVLGQIGLVWALHFPSGADVDAIHQALLTPNAPNTVGYFSVNPNNLPLLLIQHWLASQFHTTSWLFFDSWTLLFVDVSATLNLLSLAVIDRTNVPWGLYLHALWLAFFPAITIPYTDTWVLPAVSFYILCYCVLAYSNAPKLLKALAALGFGMGVSAAFFIKPSAIVPAIAIVLIEGLTLLKPQPHHWLWLGLLALLLTGSTAGSYIVGHHVVQTQTYIRVNQARAKPLVHFINMGLSGQGGYNAKDSYKMVTTLNKQARINYSVTTIKRRLRRLGLTGYVAFLWQKQQHNTSDGSFGWAQDPLLAQRRHFPTSPSWSGHLENFLFLYGRNLGDLRFLTQIWWCLWLGLIFFAWHDDRKIIQALRLAFVGGCLFLLIFEGGRSRYLIQFLPVLLLLATLNSPATHQLLHRHLAWLHAPTVNHSVT